MARDNPFAFGTDPWDPSHRFVTSWLVSPFVLFGIRATMSLYAFTTLFFNIGFQCARADLGGCEASRQSFSFFTVLTYWGIAFYNLTAATHTLCYARTGSAPLYRFPRPLQALHALFYAAITTYPYLVTIVFWSLLSSPTTLATPFSAWSNISQHIFNSVFATTEIVLARTEPHLWTTLPFLIIILALYLGLAYVTFATAGFYTYDFLDPRIQGNLVAAYVFGIAIGICVLFLFTRYFIWVRKWVTETKMGYRGVYAVGDDGFAGMRDGLVESPGKEREHELTDIGSAV
ncbi:hypothetical protein GGR50DRAFT_664177 [Xylaria sp. CBS 124048]|nr:hypothetical protein GGR50DRAFT_664177 [Xylaria sp. CBS 124048]